MVSYWLLQWLQEEFSPQMNPVITDFRYGKIASKDLITPFNVYRGYQLTTNYYILSDMNKELDFEIYEDNLYRLYYSDHYSEKQQELICESWNKHFTKALINIESEWAMKAAEASEGDPDSWKEITKHELNAYDEDEKLDKYYETCIKGKEDLICAPTRLYPKITISYSRVYIETEQLLDPENIKSTIEAIVDNYSNIGFVCSRKHDKIIIIDQEFYDFFKDNKLIEPDSDIIYLKDSNFINAAYLVSEIHDCLLQDTIKDTINSEISTPEIFKIKGKYIADTFL